MMCLSLFWSPNKNHTQDSHATPTALYNSGQRKSCVLVGKRDSKSPCDTDFFNTEHDTSMARWCAWSKKVYASIHGTPTGLSLKNFEKLVMGALLFGKGKKKTIAKFHGQFELFQNLLLTLRWRGAVCGLKRLL